VDELRRRKAKPFNYSKGNGRDCPSELAVVDPTPTPLEALEEDESRMVFLRILEQFLQEKEHAPARPWWEACYRKGETVAEIANRENLPYMTVYRQIDRLNKELRNRLMARGFTGSERFRSGPLEGLKMSADGMDERNGRAAPGA
jgi:DNA-directed RNA polymerase specialized sigma24 family protein